MVQGKSDFKFYPTLYTEANFTEITDLKATITNFLEENIVKYFDYIFCCCLVAKSCLTLLQPHGLYIAHQAPLPKGFHRQESWSDWSELPFFLQEIFLTQASDLCLMHWQTDSVSLNHQESPNNINAAKYVFREVVKSSEYGRIKVIN